ncbi:putative Copper transporter [Cucumis melo var. makuwa]|uniref:Copper transport protein n=2 Tax=Cucumis melo TaxID=3656 RepID=A0A5D3BC00_CUCMM|nr:putative Copper transporter [Cucumis melo var. makuwa]
MKMETHMTFYWGKTVEILFVGWPGRSFFSYTVALIFVFLLAFTVEWLSHTKFTTLVVGNLTAGLVQTILYGVRVGLAFIVMLAVMSYNVGVLLAAVTGYSMGFLVYGSQVFSRSKVDQNLNLDLSDLPPLNC